jgi:transglutaminase-like putative cysteine protease
MNSPDLKIRIGYELVFESPQATPMMLALHVHSSRRGDLLVPDDIATDPPTPMTIYHDGFDNLCTRLTAPVGRMRLSTEAVIKDHGQPDAIAPGVTQVPVEMLPDDSLVFLLGSRYCETDRMSQIAWDLFGKTPPGWSRVQAICEFVHKHITFGYPHARPTKTAWEAFQEGQGVCRDFTHLAVTLCRCMNIPARYCTGYVSDIGLPPPYATMDFAAWFEAYLDGGWYTFDPRNYTPRVGRILMARGRDAADVAISNSFGTTQLTGFKVITDEIVESEGAVA